MGDTKNYQQGNNMNTKTLFFIIILIFAFVLFSYANDGMGNFPKNNNIFANRLMKVTCKAQENFVISPLSLNMAMCLVSNGADGKTLQEFGSVLQNGPFADKFGKYERNYEKYSQKDMNIYNRNLLANSKKLGAEHYSIANGIWIRSPYTKEFYLTAKNYYNADVYPLTMSGAKDINSWINKKTKGKIPSMVEKIGPTDKAYIVNAIYFYSKWKKAFPKYGTIDEQLFHTENGKTINCTMMTDEREYKVLDYRGGQILIKEMDCMVAMYFMLPPKNMKLADWLKNIDFNSVITNDTEGTELYRIALPKFKIEYKKDFGRTFKEFGLKSAFGNNSDFSRLDKKNTTFISSVLHKATIGIDEKGCEASAATVIKMMGKGAPRPAKILRFDRPFAFAIIDELDNTVIFEGCVYNPSN